MRCLFVIGDLPGPDEIVEQWNWNLIKKKYIQKNFCARLSSVRALRLRCKTYADRVDNFIVNVGL